MTITRVMNTEMCSGRLYCEHKLGFFDVKGGTVPPPSASSREFYRAPRMGRQAYANLVYFNDLGRGNRFAAWKEPEFSRPMSVLPSGRLR